MLKLKAKVEQQSDHPFPNEVIMLMVKLSESLPKDEYVILADLLHKYLNLRADVFHDF
jgi:hypothetical protein